MLWRQKHIKFKKYGSDVPGEPLNDPTEQETQTV